MVEEYYSITGMKILVKGPEACPIRMFDGFSCAPSDEVMLTLEVEPDDSWCSCYGINHFSCLPGWSHVLLGSSGNGKNRMLASDDWSRLRLTGEKSSEYAWMELLAAGFYSRLTSFGGMLMHASAVKYQNSAVIFTAASGTGKTTQAELWNKYLGAEILNGDKVFVRMENQGLTAWGSPWKGSSPYAVNASAPAAAVVVLAQGGKNEIRRLSDLESSAFLFPHIFFPNWDPQCLERVMDVLDLLLKQVPVYHLTCRPDEEAVLMTKHFLEDEGALE